MHARDYTEACICTSQSNNCHLKVCMHVIILRLVYLRHSQRQWHRYHMFYADAGTEVDARKHIANIKLKADARNFTLHT